MDELIGLVFDVRTPADILLDYVEECNWSREWLWERLNELDEAVLAALARISQALRIKPRKNLPAVNAVAWLESLDAETVYDRTLEMFARYRTHQAAFAWAFTIQSCLDGKLEPWSGNPTTEEIYIAHDDAIIYLTNGLFDPRPDGPNWAPSANYILAEFFGSACRKDCEERLHYWCEPNEAIKWYFPDYFEEIFPESYR